MKLNGARNNYYYAGIDSWMILALYGYALNQKKSLASVRQKYSIHGSSKEYLSAGGAIAAQKRMTVSNIQFLAKSVNDYFKSIQNSSNNIDFVEAGIRFLFGRETLMTFTNIKAHYQPNVTPLAAPLKYRLLLEDLFIEQELTGDEIVSHLFKMNNRYIPKYNVARRNIRAIAADISIVANDAKSFMESFIDIYENGMDTEKFHWLRKLIYNANTQALENLGIIEDRRRREEAKLRREKKREQEAERRRKEIQKHKEEADREVELYNIRQELELKAIAETYRLFRPGARFQNNICITTIIDCMWVYNMIERCKLPVTYCAYITGWKPESIIQAHRLADIRYKVATDDKKNPITLIPDLSINWNTAITSDYYILMSIHRAGISIEDFKNADDDSLKQMSDAMNLSIDIVKDQQNILNCWCHSTFTDSFANTLRQIAEAPPRKVKDITDEEVQAEYNKRINAKQKEES